MGAGHDHDEEDDDGPVFELTDIDTLTETGPGHGFVYAHAEDQDDPIGIMEYHLKPDGNVCAAYFTVVPCCETGRCPHWTVITEWTPLTTQSELHCPSCDMRGRIINGRWENE